MQLKGLVRFFTILLIIYSLYQLSFTWFVRGHEKKMEAQANRFVNANFPNAKGEEREKLFADRLKRLLDSTQDKTITYGITGAISYQKAKGQELNLGLDLQGGMSVALEVEMTELLRTLANNSRDGNFNKAIDEANARKKNSDANFVTLFYEEYQKLNPNGKLASLFAGNSGGKISVNSSNNEVVSYLNSRADDAFDNNLKVLTTRIDQFGVAQPTINPDKGRGIITVELPGIQDKDRVRNYLQSSANLQFWEVYSLMELDQYIGRAEDAFATMMGGNKAPTDSVAPKSDTTAPTIGDTTINSDSGEKKFGQGNIAGGKDTTGKKLDGGGTTTQTETKASLGNYIGYSIDPRTRQPLDDGTIGRVLIKDTGLVRSYLQNEAIASQFPSDVVWMYGIKDKRAPQIVGLYAIKGREKPRLEGDVITTASMDYNPTNSQPEVRMNMNPIGAREWGLMTTEAAGNPKDETDNKHIAIALDRLVYSAPRVNEPINAGTSSISGGFTVEEAQDLAKILNAGKLSVPAKIVHEEQVGPTLGAEAIRSGMLAFAISFVVIFLLMLIYYNTSGWVANIALILNLLFTIGVLAGLGATLTAPGIAGLVLTIGMAVDTNVIIYERIKEELTKGKGYIPAINEGYRRSLPPVLDGHVTTLLTAIILFQFGLGPVKGFATTQILGIILSLFCGILVSRWITEWFTSKKRHLEYFTPLSKRIFKHANFKIIEFRKIAYIISFVVLALGVATYFNGFDYGVEFDGGRSYQIDFKKAVDQEQIRKDLVVAFEGENPILKTVGTKSTLDITTPYLITDPRPGTQVDSLVELRLYEGLKNHLPAGLTYEQFDTQYKQQYKKVLPTISDDLKSGAIKATVFAIFVIFLYIFIRFRDWRYSLGTIVALLHDVLVTLIVFSFARSVVPFPLEIDQHFIAAILTVIGFSMNDTVIVFDRIREYNKLMPNAPKTEIINRAINDTLSRTIMTSLTVFLTILILFLVGGEVTKGFAFAMLIGVITGIYSSVFVAAPILVDLGKAKLGFGKKTVAAKKAEPAQSAAPVKS